MLGGVALSFASQLLDDGDLIPQSVTGGPEAALAILGAIAASMVTLTGLVLTIVLVVVQLAMGQFSPRIVRAVLKDRPSQLAIGLFVATFAHAMLAMRRISSTEPGSPVPGLAIIVAFVLAILSIAALILYVHHIGQSLRVAALIESVGTEARDLMDELYPDRGEGAGGRDPDVVVTRRSGVVFHVGIEQLVRMAQQADCTLELLPAVGDFVPAGAPLVRVVGDSSRLNVKQVASAVSLGPERTMNQDLGYGFRMLVDIAGRSLSDSFEDPTTAVAAIDHLHDLLRQLAGRPIPPGEHRDEQGTVRLVVPTTDWDGYVRLAFDEIRLASANSIQVTRRLQAALHDLMSVVPPDRLPALQRQLELLTAMAPRQFEDDADTAEAVKPDPQGIGSAEELLVHAERDGEAISSPPSTTSRAR